LFNNFSCPDAIQTISCSVPKCVVLTLPPDPTTSTITSETTTTTQLSASTSSLSSSVSLQNVDNNHTTTYGGSLQGNASPEQSDYLVLWIILGALVCLALLLLIAFVVYSKKSKKDKNNDDFNTIDMTTDNDMKPAMQTYAYEPPDDPIKYENCKKNLSCSHTCV
jgi:beta-lactamase regulating signal transducer with metallopeptidase domain